MALITIKDLPQNDELDRQAMRSIAGGGRSGIASVPIHQAKPGSSRIVDYPPGIGRNGHGSVRVRAQRPAA